MLPTLKSWFDILRLESLIQKCNGVGEQVIHSFSVLVVFSLLLAGCTSVSQKSNTKNTSTPAEIAAEEKTFTDVQLEEMLKSPESIEQVGATATESEQIQTSGNATFEVSQVFPADQTQGISNEAVITVIFNQPVVPLVINEEQKKLPIPIKVEPNVDGTGQWLNTSVFVYQPIKPLKGGQTYKVTVLAGLHDVTDKFVFQKDFQWHFTVASPSIGSLKLSSGAENPENGYAKVFLNGYFWVDFHQPMDQASTEAALSLQLIGGEKSDLITKWNETATQIIITPTLQLALGSQYRLSIDPEIARSWDGGKLVKGLNWEFSTLQPPSILSTSPYNGERQENYSNEFQIKFISPMNIESVKERIRITPQPAGTVEWWYNDWDWSIHTYNLDPSTYYTIELLPGMKDIFGNEMKTSQRIQFTTAAYLPQVFLQMPYMPALMRSGDPNTPQEFYINYRNVKEITLELYKIDVKKFISFQVGSLSQWQYQPLEEDLVWKSVRKSSGRLNQLVLEKISITTEDQQPLEAGFYFLGVNSPQVTSTNPYLDNRLLVVSNANLTFKTTGNEALIWATDLTSGKPISNLRLSVYDAEFKELGSSSSDKDGMVYLELPKATDPYAARYVLTQDDQVFGFTFNQWGSGASFEDLGSWGLYYTPPDQSTAYIYTDRPIYRPGQPVYFKGIVRLDDDLKYRIPDKKNVKVAIRSYEDIVSEQYFQLNDFGSFSGEFTLDHEAALGYYSISTYFSGTETIIGDVSFSVAEYKKPEFQLSVEVDPKQVVQGDTVDAQVQAEYYSGGFLKGAATSWTLTADRYYYNPPEAYSQYSFYVPDEDIITPGSYQDIGSQVIAQGEGILDDTGKLKITLPTQLKEQKSEFTLTFEATVSDIAGNQVSGRDRTIAHNSKVYAGIKPKVYVSTAGEPASFEAVVIDWDGNPISDHSVNIEIVERRWHNIQEQDSTGKILWKSSIEEIPVASFPEVLVDKSGETSVEFTPPNGGVYQAKITTQDEEGNQATAAANLWVSDRDYVPWQQTNDKNLVLVSDKENYLPGEEAEILIASPYQGKAYALVTVERGHIYQHEVILLESNSQIYRLPITADLAPNIYVSVVIIKGIDEHNLRPDFKMGVVELKVNNDKKLLDISVSTDKENYKPGDSVTYTITTRDKSGKPVDTELSFSLSDLATLSLVDPNTRPIADYFYSGRALSVWTSIPMVLSIEEYNALITENLVEGKAMGAGGGKGGGDLGVIELREEFPDTAFWEAHLKTGEDGQEKVTVTLPDNLTTWRSDIRAVTKDTEVGQSSNDIKSTKPLIVRPQTPRFFTEGDKAQVGATIQNNTDEDIQVAVTIDAEGVRVLGNEKQTITVKTRNQSYVKWDVEVINNAKRVDLVISAKSDKYSDASRPTLGTLENQGLPVYRYEARETVGTSGILSEGGSKIEAISLPKTMDVTSGQLNIEVAPSLVAGLSSALTYLEDYPYECVEQTVSRFLPNVLIYQALKLEGIKDQDKEAQLQKQVSATLQRLYNWQNPDGGWGWWGKQQSNVMTTAYALLGLSEAKKAELVVSDDVLNQSIQFLQSQLLPVSKIRESYQFNQQVFLLYALSNAGKLNPSEATLIYDRRLDMGFYARAMLAQVLYELDPTDNRVQTILSDLVSAAQLSATGASWHESTPDFYSWNTDTRTTAIILSVLSTVDAKNELVANAVRWLMDHRTGNHWQTTQETAWSIMALTHWMVSSNELNPEYKFGIALNDKSLAEQMATSSNIQDAIKLRVDISELFKDRLNNLAFIRTQGPGNLYYTTHLEVSLPVEKIESLDKGIIVSRSYYAEDNLNKPVQSAKVGEILLARLTIINPGDLNYLLVDSPLPAGLELVDQSLLTSVQEGIPADIGLEDMEKRGWGWWYFNHVELRDEKLVLSVDYLPAGTYVYTYLVRAVLPGVYQNIPPVAEEFYFPEVYGRGAGGMFTVNP